MVTFYTKESYEWEKGDKRSNEEEAMMSEGGRGIEREQKEGGEMFILGAM